MDDESKKPCAPVEEEGRDYNELGLYLHGKTMQTAMELWEMLPGWMQEQLEYILSNIDTENLSGDLQEKLK